MPFFVVCNCQHNTQKDAHMADECEFLKNILTVERAFNYNILQQNS